MGDRRGGGRGAGFTKQRGKKVRANASENSDADIPDRLSVRGSAPLPQRRTQPLAAGRAGPAPREPLEKSSPGGAAPKFCRSRRFFSRSPRRGDRRLFLLRVALPAAAPRRPPVRVREVAAGSSSPLLSAVCKAASSAATAAAHVGTSLSASRGPKAFKFPALSASSPWKPQTLF